MLDSGTSGQAGLDLASPSASTRTFLEARKMATRPPDGFWCAPMRHHANPIEEVTITAKATDEYGLTGVTLHYSVNGGPETAVDVSKGVEADGSTTLSLESFQARARRSGQPLRHREGRQPRQRRSPTDMVFSNQTPSSGSPRRVAVAAEVVGRTRHRPRADLAAREIIISDNGRARTPPAAGYRYRQLLSQAQATLEIEPSLSG